MCWQETAHRVDCVWSYFNDLIIFHTELMFFILVPLPAEEGLPRPGDKYFGCWLNFRAPVLPRSAPGGARQRARSGANALLRAGAALP
jgi:hypothetical protein